MRDEGPAPWERQPGEPTKAYAAFCAYRDMPASERSLRALTARLGYERAAKGGRVPSHIQRWSTRWRWVERARAWDDEQDRRAREEQLLAVQEMRQRHAREAVVLQQKALARLKAMNPEELSPSDVLRYFIEAAKLERISRGEPETIQEQRGDWTQAVLWAYEHLRAPAQQRDGGQGRDG